MTTSDPHVLWAVILASAGSYLLLALLVKYLLDEHSAQRRTPAGDEAAPAAPHARPAAPDETAPITTVQSARARHRKG